MRQATDCSSWSDNAIWVEASKYAAKPKVRLWLDRVRQDMLADTKITLESHTRELLRLAKAAEASGNYGAAAKCIELTGRATGLYVDRIKTDDPTLAVAQVLERIALLQPAVAAELAASMGLDMSESDNQDSTGQPDSAKSLKSLH